MVPTARELIDISNGFPPVSSKITSKLLEACSHERGIWYLEDANSGYVRPLHSVRDFKLF